MMNEEKMNLETGIQEEIEKICYNNVVITDSKGMISNEIEINRKTRERKGVSRNPG